MTRTWRRAALHVPRPAAPWCSRPCCRRHPIRAAATGAGEAAGSLIFYSSGSAGDVRKRVCTARIMSCTNSQKFTFFPVTYCSFFYRPRLWKFIFMCHLLPQGVELAKNITISSPLITDYLCKGRIIILDILEDSPCSPQLPPAKVVLNDTFMEYSKGQYYQLKLNIEHESSELRMLEGLLKEENYLRLYRTFDVKTWSEHDWDNEVFVTSYPIQPWRKWNKICVV